MTSRIFYQRGTSSDKIFRLIFFLATHKSHFLGALSSSIDAFLTLFRSFHSFSNKTVFLLVRFAWSPRRKRKRSRRNKKWEKRVWQKRHFIFGAASRTERKKNFGKLNWTSPLVVREKKYFFGLEIIKLNNQPYVVVHRLSCEQTIKHNCTIRNQSE